MISVQCQECGARYKVPVSMQGRRAHCTCGEELVVPSEEESDGESSRTPDGKAEKWFIQKGKKKYGPVNIKNLALLIKKGKVGKDDGVYNRRLDGWKKVGEIPQLQKLIPKKEARWYCYKSGKIHGPYTPRQFRALIKKGHLGPKTRVREKSKGKWELLSAVDEFSDLVQKVAQHRSTTSSKPSREGEKNVWYYMRNGSRYGPLSSEKLLSAIKEGQVRPADRVWTRKLDNWKKVSEVPQLNKVAKQAEGHREGELWYYRHRGEVHGPISLYRLKELIEQAKIVAGDHVFNKKLGKWTDVRKVPKLREVIDAARRGEVEAKDESSVWFYHKDGEERGPLMLRDLAKRFASGALGPDTKVYGPGSDKWRKARKVSELARFISGQDRSGAESDTGVVEAKKRKKKKRKPIKKKKKWLPAAAGIGFVVLVAIALLVYDRLGGGGGQKPPTLAAPTSVEVPSNPRAVVRTWLGIFLTDPDTMGASKRRTREKNLKKFYPEEQQRLDAYAADVRVSLQRLVESGGMENLKLQKMGKRIVRARDRESFCYHYPFKKDEVKVFKPIPGENDSPVRLQKVINGDQFRLTRIYRLLYDGEAVHPSGYVLLTHIGDEFDKPWRIVYMGRVAHIGAQWNGRRVKYITGYKASSMRESESFLQVGTARRPEGVGSNHAAFGQVMSVDAHLVPPKIIQRHVIVAEKGLSKDYLVIMGDTSGGQDLSKVTAKYGEPAEIKNITLSSSNVRSMEPSGGKTMGLYSEVKLRRYGGFSVATDTISGQVAGFVFRRQGF